MNEPQPPAYDTAGLATVLPSVARALGIPEADLLPPPEIREAWAAADAHAGDSPPVGEPFLELPRTRRAVVVLVDGLGDQLLSRRGGHAPFVRSLRSTGRRLQAGFPTTTATSMGTFGTGLPPGAHGLVGYEVLDPEAGSTFNELNWKDGPDPRRWQPAPTVFERVAAAGIPVTMVGPHFFDGSGLTTAALRGAAFRSGRDLSQRVDEALAALRASDRALVYLYWGEVDKVGHVHGCTSWQWGEEVESTDAELARLARSLPTDTALYITADHGMVDIPMEDRLDIAYERRLAEGVSHVGGEPRALQLYCRPGAAAEVATAWREVLGDRAWVRERAQVERLGWFGPIHPRVRPRIGDVLVAMRAPIAVVDSRIHRPELLALLGLHGSFSPEETDIPLLTHVRAGRA